MPNKSRTLRFEVKEGGQIKRFINIPDGTNTFTVGRFDRVTFETEAGPFTVDLDFKKGSRNPEPWPSPLVGSKQPDGMFRTETLVVNPRSADKGQPFATYAYVIRGVREDNGKPFRDESLEGDFES